MAANVCRQNTGGLLDSLIRGQYGNSCCVWYELYLLLLKQSWNAIMSLQLFMNARCVISCSRVIWFFCKAVGSTMWLRNKKCDYDSYWQRCQAVASTSLSVELDMMPAVLDHMTWDVVKKYVQIYFLRHVLSTKILSAGWFVKAWNGNVWKCNCRYSKMSCLQVKIPDGQIS